MRLGPYQSTINCFGESFTQRDNNRLLKLNREELSDLEDGVLVMKNGCMCCSGGGPGDELERVLEKLSKLVDKHGYDYVVIETTGLTTQ